MRETGPAHVTQVLAAIDALVAAVTALFGFSSSFSRTARTSFAGTGRLWQQTLCCYIDIPIPTRFQERLTTVNAEGLYLSRKIVDLLGGKIGDQ